MYHTIADTSSKILEARDISVEMPTNLAIKFLSKEKKNIIRMEIFQYLIVTIRKV